MNTPTTGADSPTPRTDAEMNRVYSEGGPRWFAFARQLERELTEARAQLKDAHMNGAQVALRAYQLDLADLRAQLAALEQDKKRLDWLERHHFSQLICTDEGGVHRWICQDRKDIKTISCAGWTARAAIDAALNSTKPTT